VSLRTLLSVHRCVPVLMRPKGRNGNIKILETMRKEMKLLIDRFGLNKEHDLVDLQDFAYDNSIEEFVDDRLYCEIGCDKFESDVYGYEKYYVKDFVLHVYPFGCGRDDFPPSLFRIKKA